MNVRFFFFLRCTAVRSSSSESPPRRLSSALYSQLHPLRSFPVFFFFYYLYVARFNDTKVTYNSIRTHTLSLSLASPFTPSLALFLFLPLSNTGRVLSDKNSSLNKHTIQKLLSYRLTASVKRIVLFYLFFSSSLSPFPPSLPRFFKYLKKS